MAEGSKHTHSGRGGCGEWLREALRLLRLGQAEAARLAFAQTDPACSLAWYEWGRALFHCERYEEAVDAY
jgi:tetratricopeptide (TPR) repeat protein